MISTLRKELRRFADGLKIEADELREIIKNEIIKRETIDSEEGKKAESKVNRYLRKTNRTQNKSIETPTTGEKAKADELPEPFKPPKQ